MIRVGFILTFDNPAWTGGLNYFKNLLRAISRFQGSQIQPVLFTVPEAPQDVLDSLSHVDIVKTPRVRPSTWAWKTTKVAQRLFGRDPVFEAFLKQHRIDVLSHSGHLGRRSTLPTVAWIPDFQHHHLPHLFSDAEQAERDARFTRLIEWCTTVIVSSHDARRDLLKFAPHADLKCKVLQFVSEVEHLNHITPLNELAQRYQFSGPYFHLPNQFWAHKNHRAVIDALKILRDQGRPALVLATGNTKDLRNPDFFPALMAHAQASGVASDFRVLGLVSYNDMRALMHHSTAVINPSLFEGWSTSVEESKSLGKAIVLSDLPVHREQAPSRGHFFDPRSPSSLATAMTEVLDRRGTANTDDRHAHLALEALPKRLQDFASTYQDIVLNAAAQHAARSIAA